MITKLYLYILRFDPGSAEVRDRFSQSLWQAVWRAHIIPEHRIAIEAHDDWSDAREVDMAIRRLEALRRHFLAECVVEQRLEMQTHLGNCCQEAPAEYARRAEIRLFPRVASLCSEVGDQFLTFDEVSVLHSAREAMISHNHESCQQLEEQHGKYVWKRIVGYDSLKRWAEAGARHPIYDGA